MSCPECFRGAVHAGEPRGQAMRLHGLNAYVTEPTGGRQVKGIIVIIPDIFGWEFINSRILADHYADKGDYKVILPDFMHGQAIPVWMLETMRALIAPGNYLSKPYQLICVMWAFIPFMIRNRFSTSFPAVKGYFEQLRQNEGTILPIGPLIDAAFTGHPSWVGIPGDIEKLTLPVSFALGDLDNHISPDQAEQIRAIVEAKPESAKGEVILYENCAHGFAVRGDLKSLEVASQAAKAEDQCIAWFNKHFKRIDIIVQSPSVESDNTYLRCHLGEK
ncbi:hypothetical protein EDB81DRAFT_951656 [Dactylonectria macrodidyma]|uniref:Dienelactone hydrolase domain-containing protein n=1 Tax=Dactylonectria macrodidyma TaxID=307937 RepID=A0A9P9DSW0_9HYPO|nr:hypothetical protein EDB81DRAFT_951656 [Dactylonectria macrodidyma]